MEFVMADEKMFIENMEEFGKLYQTCFSQSMSAEEVQWRYIQNPHKDILACFALDEGRIIANYSVSPVELINNGKIIKAGLSLNTMTHPDYVGRGLFVKLASAVYSEMERSGYKLVFGFPNYISNRTFVNKLGWKDIAEIPMMELDLSKISDSLDDSNEIIEDSQYNCNYDLCNIKSNKIMVRKTQEYMIWKYKNNPTNVYKNYVLLDENNNVRSRIVMKEYKNRLNIVDYYMENVNDAEKMFLFAIYHAKKLGKDLITLWSVLGSAEHLVLEKLGFRNSVPVTYFGANVFTGSGLDYYEYKNWEINLSDDNVF